MYYYWVVAIGECSRSASSLPDAGYAGGRSLIDILIDLWERVFPSKMLTEDVRLAEVDSTLAIRLRSDEAIDPDTVYGLVSCRTIETDAAFWLLIDEDAANDGWVIYEPDTLWMPGDTITMTAGAQTVSGEPVGPVTYDFLVQQEDPEAVAKDGWTSTGGMPSGAGQTIIWQPQAGTDYDGGLDAENSDLIQVADALEEAVLPLEYGVGAAYVLGPDQVFMQPQRVWLPLPEGVLPSEVALYYYYQGEDGEAGWYSADHVEGWVVPDSYLALNVDGVAYLGFVVRHAGTAQLGYPTEGKSTSASILPGVSRPSGDALLLALAAGTLLVYSLRKKYAAQR